jgi:sigma-B regulation protein RsbU (phosphoserine phosphatase)
MDSIFTHSLHTGINLGLKTSNEINFAMIEQAKKNLQSITDQQAGEINDKFIQTKGRLVVVADFLEQSYKKNTHSKNSIPQRAKNKLSENESLLNDTVFIKYELVPWVVMNENIRHDLLKISDIDLLLHSLMRNNKLFDNIYIATENGILYSISKYRTIPEFNPYKKEWYKKGIEAKGEPVWIDTHIDIQGAIVVACARAFYNQDGQIAGVIGINIKHSDLIKQMLNRDSTNGSFNFLLDKKGTYIGENSILNANEMWYEALRDISIGQYQSKIVSIDSKDYYLFFSQIEDNNWSLGLMMPTKNVSLPIEETKIKIATQIEEAKQSDRTIFFKTLQNFSIIFILTAIISTAIAIILSRSITKPLEKLMQQVNNIGKIDSLKIELDGKDELADLSRAFNKMSEELFNYIKELEYMNVQTEYIASELEIARIIQSGLLPNLNADFLETNAIDFYARITPAKEIGGDFYDFFYMDSDKSKICFLIADVSGKGIPAAIYMAQAKTLVKTSILQTKNLILAMKYVNSVLSENNETCMFIAIIALSIDLKSKKCVMLNCGHNNPIASINGKPYELFKMKNTAAIGMNEETEYEEQILQLEANDRLYLYTDGVIEAMNNKMEFFGNDRLLECANNNLSSKPKDFDNAIRAEIMNFTDRIQPSDDITTLAIQIL